MGVVARQWHIRRWLRQQPAVQSVGPPTGPDLADRPFDDALASAVSMEGVERPLRKRHRSVAHFGAGR